MLRARSARLLLPTLCSYQTELSWAAWSRIYGASDPTVTTDERPCRISLLARTIHDPARRPLWEQGTTAAPGRSFGSMNGGEEPRVEKGAVSSQKTWIEQCVPGSVLPYVHLARLHKPIGAWLLAWPCLWSIAMATAPGQLPDLYMLTLYGTGAVVRC